MIIVHRFFIFFSIAIKWIPAREQSMSTHLRQCEIPYVMLDIHVCTCVCVFVYFCVCQVMWVGMCETWYANVVMQFVKRIQIFLEYSWMNVSNI